MSKLFKPKTMRRIILFLLLILPFVYTFGSYLALLVGAHGAVSPSSSDVLYRFIWGFDVNGNLGDVSWDIINPWLLQGYQILSFDSGFFPEFAPLSGLLRIIFDSVFNTFNYFDYSENIWGCFFVGVIYYEVLVVLIYEFVVIALKLLLLPLRAVEAFERKGDE